MSDCLNLVRMFASSKLTRFVSSSLLAQLRMSLMKLVRPRGADMLPARLDGAPFRPRIVMPAWRERGASSGSCSAARQHIASSCAAMGVEKSSSGAGKLAVCTVGIYASYLTQGLVQEQLSTRRCDGCLNTLSKRAAELCTARSPAMGP